MNIETLQALMPLLTAAGSFVAGLLTQWLKGRADRHRAAAVAGELDRMRRERDQALTKASGWREQHEALAVELAELKEVNAKLRKLRSVAAEKVPPAERAYYQDTGLGAPDLTPRPPRPRGG